MKDSNPHVHKTVVFKTTAITNSANLPNKISAEDKGFEPLAQDTRARLSRPLYLTTLPIFLFNFEIVVGFEPTNQILELFCRQFVLATHTHYLILVVAVGFEPTNLKGTVLQTACFNPLHTLPYYSNFKLISWKMKDSNLTTWINQAPLSQRLYLTTLPIFLSEPF